MENEEKVAEHWGQSYLLHLCMSVSKELGACTVSSPGNTV